MSALPPVFIEFLGKSTGVKTAIRGVETELATVDAEGAGSFSKTGMMGKAAILGLGLAAAETAKKTVEMAGDFQVQMTRVRTGAGEAAANMQLVSQGVLAMAGQVGQSTTELTAGLYMVESAGYHGADALTVLKTSAQGAKVGAADLKTTTDAVTTAMNAYKSGAGSVTQVMNALIGTEAEGKTNLEDLAGSMSAILPTAAAAKVGLDEVLGAMATMTAQGTPARVAATYLRMTIGMLSNPTAKARTEMKNLGLNAVEVSKNLGTHGLASTLTMLTDAIEKHMGPAGTVLINQLRDAAGNTTAYQKILANLPPTQQTYIGALATMVGGTKSMMGALQLTGPHMVDFQRNTKGITEHVKAGGKEVEGWTDVQHNFNQKVDQAKASLQAMGIQIGQILMPYVEKLVGWIAQGASWLAAHTTAAKVAAGIIGGILVFAIAAATAALIDMAVAAATNPMTWIVLAVVAVIAAIVLLVLHWKQVWGAIVSVARATGRWIAGIWDDVRDATVSAWNAVVDAVVGAWDDTVDALSGAWDAVVGATVSAWDTVVDAVVTAWDDTVDFFVSAWHTVVDPIVGAWHAVWGATVAVWDAISGWFRKWWPLLLVIFMPFVATVVAIWNHFHEQIMGVVHTVWNGIMSFLRLVWAGIVFVAVSAWTGFRLAVITPVLAVWHQMQALWTLAAAWLGVAWAAIRTVAHAAWTAIRTTIIQPVQAGWSEIKSLWTTAMRWLGAVWSSVRQTAAAAWARIKAAMTGPLTAAWHTITSIGGRIRDAVKSKLDAAWSAVKTIGTRFEQIGKAIVDGIIRGVEHSGGALKDELGNLANNALSSAKSFLGINSPSKLFADQVGSAIPEGIAKGVADNAALAHRAVGTLAAGLPSAAMLTSGSYALGLGAGGGATVIQQHVHLTVQGHVMTDKQLVSVVQEGFLELGAQNPVTYQPYNR